MKMTLSLTRHIFRACAVALMISGCGGSLAQVASPGAMPRTATVTQEPSQRASWISPEARGENLVYVASNWISVWTYPSGALVGVIDDLKASGGICVEKSGNILVVNPQYYRVEEYPHGSLTPSALLRLRNDEPHFCAIDPSTGNLAVTGSGPGLHSSVAFFAGAKGRPKYVNYPNEQVFLGTCTYDSKSNLFVEVNSGGTFLLAELPKGSNKFVNLKFHGFEGFKSPNPVQWDGKYLTVGNQTTAVTFIIYRFKVTGKSVSVVGHSTLRDDQGITSTWFQGGNTVIGASVSNSGLWRYPAGGDEHVTYKGTYMSTGVGVSLAPK
jgi:hypothetical protein